MYSKSQLMTPTLRKQFLLPSYTNASAHTSTKLLGIDDNLFPSAAMAYAHSLLTEEDTPEAIFSEIKRAAAETGRSLKYAMRTGWSKDLAVALSNSKHLVLSSLAKNYLSKDNTIAKSASLSFFAHHRPVEERPMDVVTIWPPYIRGTRSWAECIGEAEASEEAVAEKPEAVEKLEKQLSMESSVKAIIDKYLTGESLSLLEKKILINHWRDHSQSLSLYRDKNPLATPDDIRDILRAGKFESHLIFKHKGIHLLAIACLDKPDVYAAMRKEVAGLGITKSGWSASLVAALPNTGYLKPFKDYFLTKEYKYGAIALKDKHTVTYPKYPFYPYFSSGVDLWEETEEDDL